MPASSSPTRVAVVVLGDLGRSPRMQYQALALANGGSAVDLIGLAGSEPIAAVKAHPNIQCHLLPDAGAAAAGLRSLVAGGLRVLAQAWRLAALLRRIPAPDFLLVQNPPALPSLPLAWLAARRGSTRLIIDWHNLGHAMVALQLGPRHWAVGLTRWIEGWVARRAAVHLCVSRALAEDLSQRWQVHALVQYDQPGPEFQPLPLDQREAELARILAIAPDERGLRPRVAVSSTSWSIDEDFGLLLAAAELLDQRLRSEPAHPGVIIVITGAGPRRAGFEQQRDRLALAKVEIRTIWLAWPDYRKLLAAADLGVCLHRSASGLDLPMKIQDMFGAGLPVCALDYGPCLAEIIRPGDNGELFTTPAELAAQLHG